MPARTRLLSVFVALVALVAACAPSTAPSTSSSNTTERAPTKKVVTVADSYEPKAITETFLAGHQTTGNNVRPIFQDNLFYNPQFGVYEPQLAVEIPSIEKGTWKVNPDGTMETIWKLRPNVKWHDGQPFTSDDLVFTYDVSRDTEIAGPITAAGRLMDSVAAPDPLTFIIHWNAPFVTAAITGVGDLLPRHLVGDLYAKDKESLGNSPLFSTEFVGLGPYRMVRWEQGALVEAARFDDYYRGRPPLDTIVMRFVSDPNALVANILSGTVDAVLSGASGTSINLDQAVDVKHRWEGTGNQVLTSQTDSAIWAFGQYQAEYSVPKDVMNNLQVRQALLHAIDRPALAEVLTAGLSPVADSYVPPADPRYPEMEPFIAKFPYDTARAQQLLGQAGWNRGADGVFTRASDGQRLELDFWVRGGATEKAASIIADNWNRVGIATTPYVIPAARRTDREYEVKRPGFLCCIRAGPTFEGGTEATVRAIPTAATNWQGLNYGGYVNPKADALVERLTQTLDPRARLPIAQQLVQEYTSDVALMPLWWEVFPMLMLQGVKGPRPNFVLPLANIFEWDKT
jgi:peptide/nickel transport system substrate-binding protein